MALLTPDLWCPWPQYPAIYFFVAHGGIVVGIAVLVMGRVAPLRSGAVWRAFGMLLGYAALVGAFNAITKANYMYLCRKRKCIVARHAGAVAGLLSRRRRGGVVLCPWGRSAAGSAQAKRCRGFSASKAASPAGALATPQCSLPSLCSLVLTFLNLCAANRSVRSVPCKPLPCGHGSVRTRRHTEPRAQAVSILHQEFHSPWLRLSASAPLIAES